MERTTESKPGGTGWSAAAVETAVAGLAWLALYLLALKAIDTGSLFTYLLAAISLWLAAKHSVLAVRGLRRMR